MRVCCSLFNASNGGPGMRVIWRVFLTALLLITFLPVTQTGGATLARLRVGYPSPSANFYPLFATKEANLFEKQGLETEMIYVQGVQLIAVQVAGQLEFSSVSGLVLLQASVEGSDLSLVSRC